MTKGETSALQTLYSFGLGRRDVGRGALESVRDRRGASGGIGLSALVIRHGPMVLGVCRRTLRDPHDVDDAFQATFLVLVRKAVNIRVNDSLGRWLYGVSRRIAAPGPNELGPANRSQE